MRTTPRLPSRIPRRALSTGAFSLPEVMVVGAIFSLLILATVGSQVFGLKLYRIAETKLTTTADARGALNRIRDEIRSGRLLYVGNGDAYSFTLIADNAPHTGNALRICPTTDTNNFVYYYLDAVNNCLNRMVSGSDSVQVIANHVTNRIVFQAEDFQGKVLTNYQNNRVIAMKLQFYSKEFSVAKAGNGPGGLYDYYQLQTRIARRTIE